MKQNLRKQLLWSKYNEKPFNKYYIFQVRVLYRAISRPTYGFLHA